MLDPSKNLSWQYDLLLKCLFAYLIASWRDSGNIFYLLDFSTLRELSYIFMTSICQKYNEGISYDIDSVSWRHSSDRCTFQSYGNDTPFSLQTLNWIQWLQIITLLFVTSVHCRMIIWGLKLFLPTDFKEMEFIMWSAASNISINQSQAV